MIKTTTRVEEYWVKIIGPGYYDDGYGSDGRWIDETVYYDVKVDGTKEQKEFLEKKFKKIKNKLNRTSKSNSYCRIKYYWKTLSEHVEEEDI